MCRGAMGAPQERLHTRAFGGWDWAGALWSLHRSSSPEIPPGWPPWSHANLALFQFRTVTINQARSSTRSNRHSFPESDWWSPTRGARLPLGVADLESRCRALLLVQPDAVFTGPTAADLWGCSVAAAQAPLEVTRQPSSGGNRRPGHQGRRRKLPDPHITKLRGIPLTTTSRTLIDLASAISLPLVVAFGDFALRAGMLSIPDLHGCLMQCGGQRGIRLARLGADMLDARAESPRESMVRVILTQAGLPAPTPQLVMRSDSGEFIARGDLVYEEAKIVIEYDGEHHLTREQQDSDANRRHRLALHGWLVVTLTPGDLRDPRRAVRKVEQALAVTAHDFPAASVQGERIPPHREVAHLHIRREGEGANQRPGR